MPFPAVIRRYRRCVEPLRLIGYWSNEQNSEYPHPSAFVDPDWDADERHLVTHYLRAGMVTRAYLGYSPCRMCEKRDNGSLQVTDGVYTWPEGLSHYVTEHAVRLPQEFVEHAIRTEEALGAADVDETWWLQQRG